MLMIASEFHIDSGQFVLILRVGGVNSKTYSRPTNAFTYIIFTTTFRPDNIRALMPLRSIPIVVPRA